MSETRGDDQDRTTGAEGLERGGVQSVEIAADILRAISQLDGAAPLKDIAAATGMPRGKVHRYLVSLARAGLAAQEPGTGEYAIGALAITLGLSALRRSSPIKIAAGALPKLTEAARETAVLAIWGETGPTVVALEESAHPVTLNVRVGSRLPLMHSAIGRIFLGFLPEEIVRPELEREQRLTEPGSDAAAASTGQILREVRAQGMARATGELIPGINALAAPVFDHQGKLAMVIGRVGRKETLKTGWRTPQAAALKTCAAELSQKLGYHTD